MLKDSTVLKKMRVLIENPDHWIKYHSAETISGNIIKAQDKSAYRFCLLGALAHIKKLENAYYRDPVSVNYIAPSIKEIYGEISVSTFNDWSKITHKDVINVLDIAIKKATENERANRKAKLQ